MGISMSAAEHANKLQRLVGQGYRLGEQVLRHAMVGVVDTVAPDDTANADGAPAGPAQDSAPESE